MACRARTDLGLLAEILGHSEESVTRLYQHMLPERAREKKQCLTTNTMRPGSLTLRRDPKRPHAEPHVAERTVRYQTLSVTQGRTVGREIPLA